MNTADKTKLTSHLRTLCASATFIFGCGLIASILIFPLIKAWPDWVVMLSGYSVILAALALLVSSVRIGWIGYIERILCSIPQRRFPITLFVTSLLLRLMGIVVFQVDLYGDFAQNEQKAWNLSQGLGYLALKGPDPHWPPGFVLFASGIYAVTGRFPIILAIANCVLDSLTTVMAYYLARRFFAEPAARLSGALYAINPILIIADQVLTYSALLGTLLITTCLIIQRSAVMVGLLIGITALVKPIVLPAPLLATMVDLVSGTPLAKAAKRLGIVLVTMLLAIAPWTIRNYVTFDRFLLVSANGGWVLWWGNNPTADGLMPTWTAEQQSAREAEIIDLDRRLNHEALAWIKENPRRFLALIPIKQAHTWGTEAATLPRLPYRGYIIEQLSRTVTQLFYICLALAAGWGLIRYATSVVLVPELLMACLLLVLAWIAHSVYIGWSYYHQPFLSFLTVMAAGYLSAKSSEAQATKNAKIAASSQ